MYLNYDYKLYYHAHMLATKKLTSVASQLGNCIVYGTAHSAAGELISSVEPLNTGRCSF